VLRRDQGVLVPTLRQVFHYFRGDKDEKLLKLLVDQRGGGGGGGTLIFCAERRTAEHVHEMLAAVLPALTAPIVLHDETPAADRAAALDAFRDGSSELLVATMFAARGLDFPNLRHVCMYDLPEDVTAFIHCVGRTARRGRSGVVSCLVKSQADVNAYGRFQGHHALPDAQPLSFPSKAEAEATRR
jgi:superfamily II DNA/RNA helicase